MSTRTFTVFQDVPTLEPAPTKVASSTTRMKPRTLRPLGRSASAAAVLTTTRLSENNVLSLPEKENLHPLTGLGSSSAPSGKKRKASESSSVLAPKAIVFGEASGAGKSKPKAKRSDLKRKASTQSSSDKAKVKRETSKKNVDEKTATSASEAGSSPDLETPSRPSLRTSPTSFLAPIKEEDGSQSADEEESSPVAHSVTQALIDSRCYELTVSPLADVSTAYLQSSESKQDQVKDEDFSEYRTVKEELDFGTLIRDYFSPTGTRASSPFTVLSPTGISSPSSSSLCDSADELDASIPSFLAFGTEDISSDGSAPVTPKKARHFMRSLSAPNTPSSKSANTKCKRGLVTLSTPERKELYATFTFMTPKSSPIRSK